MKTVKVKKQGRVTKPGRTGARGSNGISGMWPFSLYIFEGRYTSFTTLLQGKAAPLVREVQMLRHIGQSSILKDELSRVQRLIVSVLPCRFFDFSMTMTMLFLSLEV